MSQCLSTCIDIPPLPDSSSFTQGSLRPGCKAQPKAESGQLCKKNELCEAKYMHIQSTSASSIVLSPSALCLVSHLDIAQATDKSKTFL